MGEFGGNGVHREGEEPLRHMIRSLHNKMDKHSERQEVQNEKIERLHTIVLGDPEAKNFGLVGKVDRQSKYIKMDKTVKQVLAGAAASGGAGWGLFEWIKVVFGIK